MRSEAREFFKRTSDKKCHVTGDGVVFKDEHYPLACVRARKRGLIVRTFNRDEFKKSELSSKKKSSK